MKQRVIVQALIRDADKTLLLRRSQGRPSMIGVFELPGGKLETNEQPDESMRRHIQNDTGLAVHRVQLVDSVSQVNPEEANAQSVLLIYEVVVENMKQSLKLGRSYESYTWQPLNKLQRLKLRESTKLVLEIMSKYTISDNHQWDVDKNDVLITPDTTHLVVYSDGGSRGNPGPSSAGYVILNKHDEVLDRGGLYLGITTNNQAEYQGVRIGLERAKAMGAKTVEFRIDSMLVVNQMKGIYKIKNRELWPIHERIKGLISQFDKVTFTHVPRGLNQLADAMVNSTLDKHRALTV